MSGQVGELGWSAQDRLLRDSLQAASQALGVTRAILPGFRSRTIAVQSEGGGKGSSGRRRRMAVTNDFSVPKSKCRRASRRKGQLIDSEQKNFGQHRAKPRPQRRSGSGAKAAKAVNKQKQRGAIPKWAPLTRCARCAEPRLPFDYFPSESRMLAGVRAIQPPEKEGSSGGAKTNLQLSRFWLLPFVLEQRGARASTIQSLSAPPTTGNGHTFIHSFGPHVKAFGKSEDRDAFSYESSNFSLLWPRPTLVARPLADVRYVPVQYLARETAPPHRSTGRRRGRRAWVIISPVLTFSLQPALDASSHCPRAKLRMVRQQP